MIIDDVIGVVIRLYSTRVPEGWLNIDHGTALGVDTALTRISRAFVKMLFILFRSGVDLSPHHALGLGMVVGCDKILVGPGLEYPGDGVGANVIQYDKDVAHRVTIVVRAVIHRARPASWSQCPFILSPSKGR
ncbi:MAG: hypothetical protein IIC82_00635 [Chloroflexi bacterium]|nr:hypothetical protein [Chloroflexota bacterium]